MHVRLNVLGYKIMSFSCTLCWRTEARRDVCGDFIKWSTRFGPLKSKSSLIKKMDFFNNNNKKKMDFFRSLPFTSSREQSHPSHQRPAQVSKMEAGGECGEGPGGQVRPPGPQSWPWSAWMHKLRHVFEIPFALGNNKPTSEGGCEERCLAHHAQNHPISYCY